MRHDEEGAHLARRKHLSNYDFHDYKTPGIDRDHLTRWCNEHGWQTVFNRAGTTFRKLDDERRKPISTRKRPLN